MIPLTKPLTPRSLNTIRAILGSLKEDADKRLNNLQLPALPQNAAVLIPFCNVRGLPGILFELRSKALRLHSGEICFPGGRVDKTDASFLSAALRETQEELGITPDRVDVLGEIGPPQPNFRGNMRVWPFVGFVNTESDVDTRRNMSEDDALPSLDLLALHSKVSSKEVAVAFHVPLALLADPKRHRISHFRDGHPYVIVDVKDVVENAGGRRLGITTLTSEGGVVEEGKEMQRVEVWGLTGWYLSTLMQALRIYS